MTLSRAAKPPALPTDAPLRRRRLLWTALIALLVAVESLLVWLSFNHENTRAQEMVEATSATLATDVRQTLGQVLWSLHAASLDDARSAAWRDGIDRLLRQHPEVLRVERRDATLSVVQALESAPSAPVFGSRGRREFDLETDIACRAAARRGTPVWSATYFVPSLEGQGQEVFDLCVPAASAEQAAGFFTATVSLNGLLAGVTPAAASHHALTFVSGEGERIAHGGVVHGAGVYVAEQAIVLPGTTLRLRLDSIALRPPLIPNVTVALVLGLSLALAAVVLLLTRDVRRRGIAERALAESLAFRKAMEDSLVTGLRARDLQGVVTYVNPAFCEMVGFGAAEIVGQRTPPYWPGDLADQYHRRQSLRLSTSRPTDAARDTAREGFETTFMHKDGRRFPVVIFEAPLVDGAGRHAGWMSAVLDVSEQRRIEDVSRQQQERLQAAARLASVGEMASLLSHELNQPLSAIASYAAGSLNLLEAGADDPEAPSLLKQAAERIAEQAERAGRVIQSVHNLVRRRDGTREAVRCDALIEAVLPLVRLQARRSGVQVEIDLPPSVPRVVCDRTMVEQVLINLARNGIQAMEGDTPAAGRRLSVKVRQHHPRWVTIGVIDHGAGVAPDVAERLYSPFFTTRSEGMGLGLSLCRTVVEQHGGTLEFECVPTGEGSATTTEFRFTLPAAPAGDARDAVPAATAVSA